MQYKKIILAITNAFMFGMQIGLIAPQELRKAAGVEYNIMRDAFKEITEMLGRGESEENLREKINALPGLMPQNSLQSVQQVCDEMITKSQKMLNDLPTYREYYEAMHDLQRNRLPADRFQNAMEKTSLMGPEYKQQLRRLAETQAEHCMRKIQEIALAKQPNDVNS